MGGSEAAAGAAGSPACLQISYRHPSRKPGLERWYLSAPAAIDEDDAFGRETAMILAGGRPQGAALANSCWLELLHGKLAPVKRLAAELGAYTCTW